MKQASQPVKVLYDPEADILYFHFIEGAVEEVLEAGDNVILELDEKRRIMGIEIWNASKRGVMEELRKAVMMSSKQ